MHAPRPLHPLSQDLVMSTLAVGFTKAQAEYDCPIVASNQAINHYFYMAFHPHPDEAVVEDRMSRYLDTLDEKVPLVGKRWTNEWLPMIRSRNEAERDCRLLGHEQRRTAGQVRRHDRLDDRDVVRPRSHQLRAGVRRGVVRPVHRGDAARTIRPSRTRSCRVTTPARSTPRMACGTSVASFATARRSRRLFDENHPRDLAAKLAETDEGRAFLEQLDDYLYDFGWRSDAVYDLADVPWRENPVIPLGAIARYINMPDSDDPMIQFERAVKLREGAHRQGPRQARRRPRASSPSSTSSTTPPQYAYPLTEDHAFYIDQMGIVLLRTFVLAVGDALARDGVIADRDDVFLLHRDEVREALAERWRPDATSSPSAGPRWTRPRKHRRQVRSARRPRRRSRAASSIRSWTPSSPACSASSRRPKAKQDPNVIDGVAGSPGTYRGVARVVRSLEEAGDLEDGEIMVCEMTLPPWVPMFAIAGAVVSDVGGVMSHCAIVAREFNIPAVVGTVDGTTRIKTGQTITVDGTNGRRLPRRPRVVGGTRPGEEHVSGIRCSSPRRTATARHAVYSDRASRRATAAVGCT